MGFTSTLCWSGLRHRLVSSLSSSSDMSNKEPIKRLRFGWRNYKPDYIQLFNRPPFFLLSHCIFVLSQTFVITGVYTSTVTTLERRYGLSSAKIGLMLGSYNVSYGIFTVGVSYFGYGHKPKFLGCGAALMAFGALLVTLPQYISGTYVGAYTERTHCQLGTTPSVNDQCHSNYSLFSLVLFCCGFFVMGVGATPIYTLGTSHLDDITKRGQNGLYIGLMYVFAALGPAIGFLSSGRLLKIYVDIKQPGGSSLTPNDKNWVGAWWIGYLIGATLLFIVSFPLLGFPREFPETALLRKEKNELHDTIEGEENSKHNMRSLLPNIKALLTNKPFLFVTLATTAESLAVGGFSTFLPKFLEQQFHISSSDAAFYAGLAVVPGAGGGIFLGGYLIRKLKWDCRQTIRSSAIIAFVASITTVSLLIGCTGNEVVGATVPYYNSSGSLAIQNICRGNCSCNDLYFKPICTKEDQLTYFSSCHAGCQKESNTGNLYYNCSCFPPGITVAEKGSCQPECKLFVPFMICLLALFFTTFLNNVPVLNATFRVVPEGEGSFAMGCQQVFVRFLAFIPGPILFGKLIDSTCVLWQRDECGDEERNCLEYKNKNFRYYLFSIGFVVKFLSFVFLVLALKVYKLPEKQQATNGEIIMQVFPPLGNEIKEEPEEPSPNQAKV